MIRETRKMEAIYNKLWILYYLSTLTLLIYFCIFTRMVFWDDLSLSSDLILIGQKNSLFLTNWTKLMLKVRQVISKKITPCELPWWLLYVYAILYFTNWKKNYKPTNTTNPSMFLSSSRFSSILTISLKKQTYSYFNPTFLSVYKTHRHKHTKSQTKVTFTNKKTCALINMPSMEIIDL